MAPPLLCASKSGALLIKAGQKRFFFDVGQNQKGRYMRISEVGHRGRRLITSLLEPWSIRLAVDHFKAVDDGPILDLRSYFGCHGVE